MNLERVAHRRLADAGRADGDDAVDHVFLALRRRVAAAVFGCWRCGAALAAVEWCRRDASNWLQWRMMYIAAVPVLRAVGTHAEPRAAPASRKLDTKRVFRAERDFLARAWA